MRELIYNLPDVVGIVVTVLTSLSGFGVCVVSLRKTQENDKKPGKAFWTSILITVLVIAICMVFFVLKGNLNRVPELNGWTYYNAIQTLDERNISYEFVSDDFDKDTAKITYQSLGNNELIYSWEKLVLGTSDKPEKPITTTTTAITTSSENTSSNNDNDATTSNTLADEEPSELFMRVPTNKYLESDIIAVLEGSMLNIEVSKSLPLFKETNGNYPFSWGLHLSDSLEEEINDYIVEIEVCIDEKYSVQSIKLNVMQVRENSNLLIDTLDNEFIGSFDGDKFTLVGDIANEYINLSDLCIQTVYFC